MEEPVVWAKSGGNMKEKCWRWDQWEKSEVPKDRTLNWVLDVEYELSDGRAACGGFPGGLEVKASAWNAGDPGSISGSGRSPGEGKWQLTPVLLPGESHGGRSLVGYSPWGCTDTTEWLHVHVHQALGLPRGLSSKQSAYQCKRCGLIPGLGRSFREGNGNPLQYACLGNPMNWGACEVTVHGVTKE